MTDFAEASNAIDQIIGFDLGHAETSISHQTVGTGAAPVVCEVTPGSRVVRTVVGSDAEGRTVIGNEAAIRRDIVDLHAKFKGPQVDRAAVAEPTTRFVRAVFAGLLESGTMLTPTTMVVFGHPSGWTPAVVASYRTLLTTVCSPARVIMMPESRAAFLTIAHEPRSSVHEEDIHRRVLIVDVGSSTTDFTVAERGETWNALADTGNFGGVSLGAGLIEDFLFDRCLARSTDRKRLERWFADNPGDRVRALLAMREAKEEFFTHEATVRAQATVVVRVVDFGARKPLRLELRVTAKDFDDAVDTRTADLGGDTWRGRMRSDLKLVATALGDRQPQLVVVTGGGARMSFTSELVREVFGDTALVIRGRQPEHAISIGLAWGGTVRLRIDSFRREVQKLVDDGSLRALITSERLADMAKAIGAWQANEIVHHVLPPHRLAWGRERITNREVSDRLMRLFNQRLADPDVQERLTTYLGPWLDDLTEQMSALVAPIANDYDIRRDAARLRLSDESVAMTQHQPLTTVVRPMLDTFLYTLQDLAITVVFTYTLLSLVRPVTRWTADSTEKWWDNRPVHGRLWRSENPEEVAALLAKLRRKAARDMAEANTAALTLPDGLEHSVWVPYDAISVVEKRFQAVRGRTPDKAGKPVLNRRSRALVETLEEQMITAVNAWAHQVEVLII